MPGPEGGSPPPEAITGSLDRPVPGTEGWVADSGKISRLARVGGDAFRYDELTEAERESSPAEEMGVVDGEFLVRNPDGSFEKGWTAEGLVRLPTHGNIVARISRPDPNSDDPEAKLVRDVPASEFAGWQSPENHIEFAAVRPKRQTPEPIRASVERTIAADRAAGSPRYTKPQN
jgi:hypothetical protein